MAPKNGGSYCRLLGLERTILLTAYGLKKRTKKHKKNTQKKRERKQVSPSEKPMLIKRGTDKKGKKNKEKGGKKRAEGQGWHGES
jgi:hypothetical protein